MFARLWTYCLILPFVTVLSQYSDVCSMVKNGETPNALGSHLPSEGAKSGTFYNGPRDGDISSCVSACCSNAACNVAFLAKGSHCYLIVCNSESSCQPKSSSNPSQKDSLFVWVRHPQDPTPSSSAPEASTDSAIEFGQGCGSDVGTCAPGLVCRSAREKQICSCPDGQSWDAEDGTCKIISDDNSQVALSPKACEQGLSECPPNEHCVVNSPTKRGQCQCLDSFERNESGVCVDEIEAALMGNNFMAQTLMPKREPVDVQIDGPSEVQLPSSSVEFSAIVANNKSEELTYWWSLSAQHSSEQTQVGSNSWDKPVLKLTNLKAGKYVLQLTITDDDIEGKTEKPLTVLEEQKPNSAPTAVIRPDNVLDGREGSQVVLDGSGSSDPDGDQLTYTWAQSTGPAFDLPAAQQKVLTLNSLKAGNYTFTLTVSDGRGGKDQTSVFVQIEAARDDKPKAVAGQCGNHKPGDFEVQLPFDHVYLCGNGSYDDHAITSYDWEMVSGAQADTNGVGSSVLTLSSLKPGNYEYKLTVTDTKEQQDSSTVGFVVLAQENRPPVANAGKNKTVILPDNSAILDGTQSKDDNGIAKYLWTSWPDVTILNKDRSKATAINLEEGVYRVQLNVSDEKGLNSSDLTFINVVGSKNEPPKIVAEDVTVTLPCSLAVLNASKSTDDAGILKWRWSPADSNLAALEILGQSNSEPALLLSNLRPGKYSFKLVAIDKENANDTKTVLLTVFEDPNRNETVELYMDISLGNFSLANQNKLGHLVETLLEDSGSQRIKIEFLHIGEDPTTGRVLALFYALDTEKNKVLDGLAVSNVIKTHAPVFAVFNVSSVDTKFCRNPCSGHGVCDHFNKQCICEAYWMPNLFSTRVLGNQSNCEWSVLYFVLISLLLVSTVGGTLWAMICSVKGRGRCCSRGTRRRRYKMLADAVAGKRAVSLKKNGVPSGQQLSSLLISSETGTDSEEDTIYESSAKIKNRASTKA